MLEQFYYEKRDEFNTVELTEKTSVQKATLFIFLNKSSLVRQFRFRHHYSKSKAA